MKKRNSDQDYIRLFTKLNKVLNDLHELGREFPTLRYIVSTSIYNVAGQDVEFSDFSPELSEKGYNKLRLHLDDLYVDEMTANVDLDSIIADILRGGTPDSN